MKENKMQKPVWRINTGDEPEDKTGAVIFHGEDEIFDSSVWGWSIFDKDDLEIYAYQTTRTKAAKYRGVQCYECNGSGNVVFSDFWTDSGVVTHKLEKCQHCNGRGTQWEKLSCK